MADLSLHAQAVCDAYCKEADNPYYFERSGLVAALRAAADQVVHDRVARMELRLVADELEGAD